MATVWDDLDIEEQWEHFLSFLKAGNYTFELIKDADGIDEDDQIAIEHNGRKYFLTFCSPDFGLLYYFEHAVGDKPMLEKTAKEHNHNNYNIYFYETEKKK